MNTAGTGTSTVGDLPFDGFASRLRDGRLGVRLGSFTARLRSDVAALAEPLHRLYRDYPLTDDTAVHNFHVRLSTPFRPWRRPRVRFSVDGQVPHEDLPADQALAVLEWGINLVLAFRMHAFLMLHSAAVERNGGLLLLPAGPGFGKTTLCAALAHRGWRQFSDEFGLVRPGGLDFLPLPRLMPLKNESIAVIRDFVPEAELGPLIHGTRKGTIAHVKPPADSIRRMMEPAPLRWIVFPKWEHGRKLDLKSIPREEAFMLLATNAFNYETVGESGFTTLRDAVSSSRCFRLSYSNLADAVEALTAMADEDEAS